jgi:hypothetical protein
VKGAEERILSFNWQDSLQDNLLLVVLLQNFAERSAMFTSKTIDMIDSSAGVQLCNDSANGVNPALRNQISRRAAKKVLSGSTALEETVSPRSTGPISRWNFSPLGWECNTTLNGNAGVRPVFTK